MLISCVNHNQQTHKTHTVQIVQMFHNLNRPYCPRRVMKLITKSGLNMFEFRNFCVEFEMYTQQKYFIKQICVILLL